MSMLETKTPTFKDGRTKQAFADETDINRILARAQKSGTISHINQNKAEYGDFAGIDFFETQLQLARGREIFDDLPSEVRKEFDQNPTAFYAYVNDPANEDRLEVLLPPLAAPRRQLIDVRGNLGADAPSEPVANEQPTPPASPAPETPTPAGAPPAPLDPPA